MTSTRTARPATAKQLAFIARLADERGVDAPVVDDTRAASAAIDDLLSLPKQHQAPTAEPDAGMYLAVNGAIVRVYLGQQSGRMLAKRLVEHGDDTYTWEYLGAASRWIKGSIRRMTLEEARDWGRMTTTCCVCGRRLDDPDSVDAGIGPVCAARV